MRRRSDFGSACLFLAPNFVGFLAFVAFPVVFSIVMAFTNWDLSLHNRFRDEPIRWVGLDNFIELVRHPEFWKYFGNTLFLMLGIPVGIAGSLALALALSRPLRSNRRRIRWWMAGGSLVAFALLGAVLLALGHGTIVAALTLAAGVILALGLLTGATVYRTLFYLPHFTAGVAIYLLWKQMYNPIRGPINHALQAPLDAVAAAARASSAAPWQAGGVVLWAVAAGGFGWLAVRTVRNWAGRDIGAGTALMSLLALATGGLILYGLGLVCWHLPAMAADGLEAPRWLHDYDWAKPALILMGLWLGVGGNTMLLYIAAISNIPLQLNEAADIDGADRWQRFWHVTWPQLAPTTFFIVVMAVIGGLQGGFEQARTMTQGGPFGSTTTLSYFVYNEGFETGRLGYASAVAWVMFGIIFCLTLFNYRFGSRYVNE